ncbi:hypothetical protein ACQP3D_28635, partial [Escherichia coli]
SKPSYLKMNIIEVKAGCHIFLYSIMVWTTSWSEDDSSSAYLKQTYEERVSVSAFQKPQACSLWL